MIVSSYRSGNAPGLKSYSTNFPLTENPLSEGGIWIAGGISPPRTNPQTASNHAYGTMTTFDGTNFPDSIAVLAATYHPNQSVSGTVWNSGAVDGTEIELVLRGLISPASNTGYEVDIVHIGPLVNLVSWNGPANNFTVLTSSTTNIDLSDGAVWFASIIGTVITVTCNGNSVLSWDTSGDAFKISSGSPGLGFWNQTTSSVNSPLFGWKHWQAAEL